MMDDIITIKKLLDLIDSDNDNFQEKMKMMVGHLHIYLLAYYPDLELGKNQFMEEMYDLLDLDIPKSVASNIFDLLITSENFIDATKAVPMEIKTICRDIINAMKQNAPTPTTTVTPTTPRYVVMFKKQTGIFHGNKNECIGFVGAHSDEYGIDDLNVYEFDGASCGECVF